MPDWTNRAPGGAPERTTSESERCHLLRWRARLIVVAMGMLLAAHVRAQEPAAPEGQAPIWQPSPTQSVELFPAGDVFPVYVADPHRPTNVIAVGFYTRTRIPESSSPRALLSAGGRFGMLRVSPTAQEGRSWQVSIDAGLDALFDSQYSNDGIGWDGNYGLTVTTAAQGSPFAFKVAVLHCSAHLGDEYEERTQMPRVNYTREEVSFATAWQPRERRLRLYGEVGIAYVMRSDGQERGRWQTGLEYEGRPTVLGGRMAWYAATDLSAMQELGWRLDTAIQGGLVTRNRGRTVRLFLQWYDGRSTLGQFIQYAEAAMSLGFKIDL